MRLSLPGYSKNWKRCAGRGWMARATQQVLPRRRDRLRRSSARFMELASNDAEVGIGLAQHDFAPLKRASRPSCGVCPGRPRPAFASYRKAAPARSGMGCGLGACEFEQACCEAQPLSSDRAADSDDSFWLGRFVTGKGLPDGAW